nr:MAG: hypothetical protein [Bacteriophage sp.]DAK52344.1 MAG TPA: Serine protease gd N-terminus [Caudoviricetes sp.]
MNDEINVVKNGLSYELYLNGKFICSGDTYLECIEEYYCLKEEK